MKKIVLPLVLAAGLLSILIGSAAMNRPEAAEATLTALRPLASGGPGGAQAAEEETPQTPPALTLEDIRTVSFPDVSGDLADCARYTAYHGYLQGTAGGRFLPDKFVTRAVLVTVLHRMSGQEAPEYDGTFSDVSAGDSFAGAVAWALQAGIVTGTAGGTFSPQDPISRGQLAAFLYRFAASEDGKPCDESLSAYKDRHTVPSYARLPLAWALENHLYDGMVTDTIFAGLPVSRGQLAQVLVALAASSGQEPLAQELAAKLQTAPEPSVSQARHSEIQAKVDAVGSKYGAVGMQVAVIENGHVTDTFTYGWATKGSVPMTPDHKIRVASITKVGVGLAAMILREDGVVNLDESIGTYWGVTARNPAYPNDPITIRSLLSHTSSISCLGDDASRSYSAVRSRLQGGGYSNTKPGSIYSWIYNNYAFGVLGQTLELASGRYLDEVLEDRLWSVMDIDAAFESGCIHGTDRIATLYYHDGSVSRSADSSRRITRPDFPGASGTYFAGGLTTSAKDLAKMAALLAGDGRYEGLQLLSPESVKIMESRYDYQLSDGTYQALPLRSQDNIYGRERLYYHTGSAYGVYNWMSYDPAARDGVVVLTVGASAAKDSRGIYAVCGETSQYIYGLLA